MIQPNKNEKRRLEEFLERNCLKLEKMLARGHSSFVFLVRKKGKKFALKLERDDSGRKDMLLKEVSNLKKANTLGIGPKLFCYDKRLRAILMEYVDGVTFADWLASEPRKSELLSFIEELFYQAALLDKAGLDHGQLGGKGKNILVMDGMPFIIDFEKASQKRKPHNFSKLFAWLFIGGKSPITLTIRKILFNDGA
ncbi:MAG: hypothetical protein N3F05_01930 [Candidatus Diapherotrites archaeon]|nr:hypothetical protein [Candidatus Diapherotrites archaeon]